MGKNHYFLLFLIFAVTLFGVSGYMTIEGWSFEDALYMTVITLTTTGFSEVRELSQGGRHFTMVLLVIGFGTVFYAVSAIVDSLMKVNLLGRGRKKMYSKIQSLSGHTIVCGFGRMGKVICEELQKSQIPFVVIEQNQQNIQSLEKSKLLWIEGDAADDETLNRAQIKKARVLVSAIDNDADGLYLCLAARTLNPSIFIIARANSENGRKKILMTGADKVILPYIMSGQKIAQSIINPNVEDFLEVAGRDLGESKRLELVDIPVEAGSSLVGRTLKNCGIRRDGMIVVGLRKGDRTFLFAPDADLPFKEGDTLIALGTQESYRSVLSDLGNQTS